VVKLSEPPRSFTVQRAAWEKTAKDLSAIFRSYPDIFSSQVRISFYQADAYFLNSEGTETQRPLTLAMVQINASTQAAGDGEPIEDHELFYATMPESLPAPEVMKKAVTVMAEELAALRNAPVFEDSYSGPVMFEDQAMAEFFAQRLFENGMLKTLLSNRIPTRAVKESNGHSRPIIPGGAGSGLGPSVIAVATEAGKSQAEMKSQLLELAKEEGLEYAVIVRKLKSPTSGAQQRFDPMAMLAMQRGAQEGPSVSKPILVYRVWVKDGREELVRSVKIGSLSLSSLRRMAGASQEQLVYNTLVASGGGGGGFFFFMMGPTASASGIPASFIVPRALILEELEVKKEQRDYTPKLPVVPSLLTKK
jgi:hypothetical protein